MMPEIWIGIFVFQFESGSIVQDNSDLFQENRNIRYSGIKLLILFDLPVPQ